VRRRDRHQGSSNTAPYPCPLSAGRIEKLNDISAILRTAFSCTAPSGNPTPSQADIQMTKAIVEIAKPLGIAVHDHIIVGKNGHASLKGMRLI
jgi:hypothetical protein